MAVYERTYHAYDGPLTPERTRFLVLPRYGLRDVFRSRIFASFFLACWLWPLGLALWIYAPHNASVIRALNGGESALAQFMGIDERFFLTWFLAIQGFACFLVALIVGPALISPDLRNNGLALYLSRPFSRAEYVLGKATVLIVLLSLVSWIPGLLLFLWQSYLAGWGWLTEHLRIVPALLLGSWVWILVLCLLSLALSAYLKWRPLAGAGMFGVFFVAGALAQMVNLVLGTRWGSLLDVGAMLRVIWSGLFGVPSDVPVPVGAAWLSMLSLCGFCLLLLWRKLRAYEVVR